MATVKINDVDILKVHVANYEIEYVGDYYRTLGGRMCGTVVGAYRRWSIETHPLTKSEAATILIQLGPEAEVDFWIDDFPNSDTIKAFVENLQVTRSTDTQFGVGGVFHSDGRSLSFDIVEAEVMT